MSSGPTSTTRSSTKSSPNKPKPASIRTRCRPHFFQNSRNPTKRRSIQARDSQDIAPTPCSKPRSNLLPPPATASPQLPSRPSLLSPTISLPQTSIEPQESDRFPALYSVQSTHLVPIPSAVTEQTAASCNTTAPTGLPTHPALPEPSSADATAPS